MATESYVLLIFERTGFKVGQDFPFAFSPKRISPGNKKWNLSNTSIIVGNVAPECSDSAETIIKQISENVHRVSSQRVV